MGSRYPLAAIALAKELFLDGRTFRNIAAELSEQTGRKSSSALVYRWCNRFGWAKEREELEKSIMERITEETASDRQEILIERTRAQIAAYRTMWQRGITELNELEVKRPSDAIKLIDLGLKGEQTTVGKAIPTDFLISISEAIKSEVNDVETLQRISERLIELGIRYNMRFNIV